MSELITVPSIKAETIAYPMAKVIGDKLISAFYSFSSREPEITGSIRRGEAHVGDIELLYQPRLDTDLFGSPIISPTQFDKYFIQWAEDNRAEIIMNSTRIKKFYIAPQQLIITENNLPKKILVEIYVVVPPADWGVIKMIRTGPKEFSKWIVTQRNKGGPLPSNCKVDGGQVLFNGKPALVPNEQAYFDILGLDFIPPQSRKPDWNREIYQYKDSQIFID